MFQVKFFSSFGIALEARPLSLLLELITLSVKIMYILNILGSTITKNIISIERNFIWLVDAFFVLEAYVNI